MPHPQNKSFHIQLFSSFFTFLFSVTFLRIVICLFSLPLSLFRLYFPSSHSFTPIFTRRFPTIFFHFQLFSLCAFHRYCHFFALGSSCLSSFLFSLILSPFGHFVPFPPCPTCLSCTFFSLYFFSLSPRLTSCTILST